MKGRKTGGRKLGTKNKDRSHFFDELEDEYPSFNVLVEFLRLAGNTKNEVLKFNCYKEFARYVLPQLKSVEIASVTPPEDHTIIIRRAEDCQACKSVHEKEKHVLRYETD
jgi:hypothetical protein